MVARRPDAAVAARWLAEADSLTSAERTRIFAFRHWEDAAASLMARRLMLDLAGDILKCDPQDVQLEREPSGRPFVEAPSGSGLDVSASHAVGWVAAAIAQGGRVGVDLEAERLISAGLIERCLAPSERRSLGGQSPDAAQSRFFRLWTLKEAFLKASGLGLAVDPRSLVFDLPEDEPPSLIAAPSGVDTRRWRFRSWNPTPGLWLSICTDGDAPDGYGLSEAGLR